MAMKIPGHPTVFAVAAWSAWVEAVDLWWLLVRVQAARNERWWRGRA